MPEEPLPEPPSDWQENTLTAVLDLLLNEQEGDVVSKTKSGLECRIQIRFVPEMGYTVTSSGGRC